MAFEIIQMNHEAQSPKVFSNWTLVKFGIDKRLRINGLKPYLNHEEDCCTFNLWEIL